MAFSTTRPPARRSAPHNVAPTTHSLRDWDDPSPAAPSSTPLLRSSTNNRDHHRGDFCVDDDDDNNNNSLYGSIEYDECEYDDDDDDDERPSKKENDEPSSDYQAVDIVSLDDDATTTRRNSVRYIRRPLLYDRWRCVEHAATQIPAVFLVALFHLMIGIPFGVSYFPIGWRSSSSLAAPPESSGGGGGAKSDNEEFVLDGPFPLEGKEALGIRMFLLSTIVGQLVLTYSSNFHNCIALQMVENVPFTNALTKIVVEIQGYGKEALSTLFFLFGLASVMVGCVFYILGRMELGRILYFFPAHVLVGCIGGIGIFIAKTGLEVTANSSFSLDVNGWTTFLQKFHLLALVFGFEAGLRLLTHWTKDGAGKSKFPLLSPIYFCMITPVFYSSFGVLRWYWGMTLDEEYFFPPLAKCGESDYGNCDHGAASSFWDDSVWDVFHAIDPTTISWAAVVRSIPTMIALIMFSLIHVPINIPAFAVSSNAEVDMNVELMAHGYSNGLVGILGGKCTRQISACLHWNCSKTID